MAAQKASVDVRLLAFFIARWLIPFRGDAVKHVVKRIRQVQDFLERKIAIENVSYYTPVLPEMDEACFIRSIVEEADCLLLLDVNNVYVNSFNHCYDAKTFINCQRLCEVFEGLGILA